MKEIIIKSGSMECEVVIVDIELTIEGTAYDLMGTYEYGQGFWDGVEIENETDGCIPYDCKLYDQIIELAADYVSSGKCKHY